jgi:Ser/Thr protein kinase RdoA (MazF antagonist)
VTDAAISDRTHIAADDLGELIAVFGLGDVLGRRHLAEGLMNVNWRLDTPVGSFALKRVTDVPLDRLRRSLAVLPALAADGIPVSAPVSTASGETITEVGDDVYCLFPWSAGEHVRGIDLRLSQVTALGAHLARLHVRSGMLPISDGSPPCPTRS